MCYSYLRMTNMVRLSLPPGASLVQTLIQLGPDLTSDADTVRALLLRFGISDANPPRDAQVIEIISSMARLAAEGTTLCDVGALVRALGSFVSSDTGSMIMSWLTRLAARQSQLGQYHQGI